MSRRPLTPPPPLSEPELLLPAPEALPNPLLALVHGRLGHRGQCENFKAATPAEVACVSSALRLGVAIVLHPHGLMYAAKAFSPGAAQETLDTVQTAIRRLFSMTEFVVVITKDMYGRADGTYVDPALRVGYGSQIARAVYCHPWYVDRLVTAVADPNRADYNSHLLLLATALAHQLVSQLQYDLYHSLQDIVPITTPYDIDGDGGRQWERMTFNGHLRGLWVARVESQPRVQGPLPFEMAEFVAKVEREFGMVLDAEVQSVVDPEPPSDRRSLPFDKLVITHLRVHYEVDDEWLHGAITSFDSGDFASVELPPAVTAAHPRTVPCELARLVPSDRSPDIIRSDEGPTRLWAPPRLTKSPQHTPKAEDVAAVRAEAAARRAARRERRRRLAMSAAGGTVGGDETADDEPAEPVKADSRQQAV